MQLDERKPELIEHIDQYYFKLGFSSDCCVHEIGVCLRNFTASGGIVCIWINNIIWCKQNHLTWCCWWSSPLHMHTIRLFFINCYFHILLRCARMAQSNKQKSTTFTSLQLQLWCQMFKIMACVLSLSSSFYSADFVVSLFPLYYFCIW